LTAGWRVEVTRRAERDLRRLDPPVRERIYAALEQLVADPPSGDIVRLTGSDDEWRLRIGGWRVRFGLDRETRTVVVLQALPRGRAYRD
jgi:mRNA interferase RelE/StbE